MGYNRVLIQRSAEKEKAEGQFFSINNHWLLERNKIRTEKSNKAKAGPKIKKELISHGHTVPSFPLPTVIMVGYGYDH